MNNSIGVRGARWIGAALLFLASCAAHAQGWDLNRLVPKELKDRLDGVRNAIAPLAPVANIAASAPSAAPATTTALPSLAVSSSLSADAIDVDASLLSADDTRALKRLLGQLYSLGRINTTVVAKTYVLDPVDVAYLDGLSARQRANVLGHLIKATIFMVGRHGRTVRDGATSLQMALVLRTFPVCNDLHYSYSVPSGDLMDTRDAGIRKASGDLVMFLSSPIVDDIESQRRVNRRVLSSGDAGSKDKYAHDSGGYLVDVGNFVDSPPSRLTADNFIAGNIGLGRGTGPTLATADVEISAPFVEAQYDGGGGPSNVSGRVTKGNDQLRNPNGIGGK